MGSSSKQTTGYKYFSNFLLFIGNPVEKLLGINFDKRGWLHPIIDENGNALSEGIINSPNLYGENEGGVAGKVHAKYGAANPTALQFYSDYLAANDLPPLAYPFQSYLGFEDFYLGNSGYMKEMLLWPKRTRIRNDGRRQWYEVRGDGAVVCEIGAVDFPQDGNISGELDITFINEQTGFQSGSSTRVVHINDAGLTPLSISHQGPFGYFYSGSGTEIDDFNLKSIVIIQPFGSFKCRAKVVLTMNGTEQSYKIDGADIISTSTSQSEQDPKTVTHTIYFNYQTKYGLTIITDVTGGIVSYEAGARNLGGVINLELIELTAINENSITASDINPIHKIREILTDDTAMNKPETSVNDDNFIKAADRIYDEGLGISWSITEKSCIDAINELCYHIEAGIRVNRQTGLYEMVLFRDNWFEENEIHTLAVNKIKSMSLEVANADEAINQLNVSYYNREAIKDSSFSVAENASIRNLNGRVNAEDADFPYFMNQRNAAVVSQWKLKQMSSPVWSGSFSTAAYEARKWNRYDLLKLAWPRKWQGTITVRIMKINLGTGTDVSIDFVEVVPYSSELSSNIVIDTPIDVAPLPPQACQYEPFEMPYYLVVMALGQRQVDDELAYESNYGLVGVVAEKPQNNSLYAVMMTHDGVEGEEWLRAATINYEPVSELDQSISKTSTSFTVKNSSVFSKIAVGTLVKCGSDWIGTPGEWMVFQSIDPDTGVVIVKRGALDSLPQAWGINTKLYFCGNDVAYDQTEYIAGEEVLVAALTATPSGLQELNGSIAVEMNARAFRPYPPANVKFNDVYFPETLIVTNNIVLTWSHRNRAQQTGGEILGWYDGGVTVEGGVTYAYELISENVVLDSQSNIAANTATILASVLKPNKPHTLKLWSVRDGYESYQKFEHSFFIEAASLILTAITNGSSVSGNTVPAANINVVVDESLSANMKFDGTSISGKAPAGSTITIDIQE